MFMSIARNHHFDPEALDKGLADGKDVTAQVVEYAQYCLEHEFASCADDVLFRRLRIGQMRVLQLLKSSDRRWRKFSHNH